VTVGLAIALLGLTSLALALLLVPLLLRQRAASREAYNLAVYRDQLGEVDRDVGRGLLTAEQAEAARAEIGRRILALAPAGATATPEAGAKPLAFAAVAILLLPIAAWTIYWQLGSPALPDQPFADRGADHPLDHPGPDHPGPDHPAGAGQQASGETPHIDMNEAITRLTARLKDHPDDLTGWLLLARSEISVGRYQDAADSYHRAADLSGHRADILGDWGEAQVMAAGGTVTPGARDAFKAGLGDPESAPRSRYYLALFQMQQGDAKGALGGWLDLLKDSPADADWMPLLKQRIAQAARTLGIDPATLGVAQAQAPAIAPPPTQPPAHLADTGPSGEAVAAAAKATAGASPDERQAMIRTMVEGLAARLATQPDDVDGWSRLGRSYLVLNEPQKARDAYAHAARLKPADTGLQQAYAEALIAAAGDDATGPPPEAIAVFRQILTAAPQNPEALWYVGLAEADAGHAGAAHDLWSRLLAQLPPAAPERDEIAKRIAALKPAAQ
jgi:cytochrome c-type biogenesis protein CcmH